MDEPAAIRLLTMRQAARRIGFSLPWLKSHPPSKGGPPRYEITKGAVRYSAMDLDEWLRSRRVATD